MDRPADRLKSIREQRGFPTARDAARAYGWEVSAYASHENGNRGIPPDAAIKYAKALRFSLDWLYMGVKNNRTLGVDTVPHVAFQVVPRLLWNFMKNFGELETAMSEATEFTSLPKTLNVQMPAFSLLVIGDSMKTNTSPDSFKEGDEVVFSTRAEVRPGDFVLAEIFAENEVVFRQYMERGLSPEGFMTYDLAPLNPAYRTYRVESPDQARIVARMVHAIKSYS